MIELVQVSHCRDCEHFDDDPFFESKGFRAGYCNHTKCDAMQPSADGFGSYDQEGASHVVVVGEGFGCVLFSKKQDAIDVQTEEINGNARIS